MTNGQQPKGRHSDGFRMKLLLWARFWTWRKVRPSEMKGPTQFYPSHNVRFIGETVHRKGSLNINKTNTRNAVSECTERCCFSHEIPIFTEFFYLFIYTIYYKQAAWETTSGDRGYCGYMPSFI